MAIEIREVKHNHAKGSEAEKFEKIREFYKGNIKYYQEFDDEAKVAGQVFSNGGDKINEFGGKTTVNEYEGIVTVRKLDNIGRCKEEIVKPFEELCAELGI